MSTARARRWTDLAAVSQGERRRHGADRDDGRERGRRHPARAPRQRLHLFGREVRRTLRGRGVSRKPRCTRRGLSGLFLSSHNPEVKENAIFRHVRVIKPVKVGFQPYRDYIGSRLEILNVTNGHRNAVLLFACAVRSAELAARWLRADLQRQRHDAAVAWTLVEIRSRDAHTVAHRHGLRDPQQQRSRVVVRWHAARHQRPEHGQGSRPSSRCRRAAACRSASLRSRPATCTAGHRTRSG